jgi:hypothetical protein
MAGVNSMNQETGEVSEWSEINIKAGKRRFIYWRAFQ